MTNPSDPLQEANDAAARAALAWLQAVGLAAEIDMVRFRDGCGPIPAPGLTTLVADAGRASADAALAADRVASLARGHEASDAAVTAVGDALNAAAAAERTARVVAQLALGVSAHLIGDDRVERLDRAAVAVLYPPAGPARVGLVHDGVRLRAKVRPELVVEIAGALCRVLVEHDASLRLRGPADAEVEVSVKDGTTLQVLTTAKTHDLDGDWESAGAGWIACWPSPVTVRGPAEAIADLLLPHRRMSRGDVSVAVSSAVADVGRPPVSAPPVSPARARPVVHCGLSRDAVPSELKVELPSLLSQAMELNVNWSLSIERPPCCAREMILVHEDGLLKGFAAAFGLGSDWKSLEDIELLRIGWTRDPEHPYLFESTCVYPQLDPTLALALETLEVMVGPDPEEPLRVHFSLDLGPHSIPRFFWPLTEQHSSQN